MIGYRAPEKGMGPKTPLAERQWALGTRNERLLRVVHVVDRLLVAIGLVLIGLWRYGISPFLGNHCRYQPTCSQYTAQALKRHGLIAGLELGVRRILRCGGPFVGGHDPVPEEKK